MSVGHEDEGAASDEASPVVSARAPAVRIPPERLDAIETRLLRAEAPADFVPDLAAEWGRSQRRVWDYVARVRKRLAERAAAAEVDPKADAEIVRGMALDAFRTARAGGEKGPDAKGMVAATKLYAEITGALAPKRLDLTSKGEKVGAMSDDELAARIAELERGG